MTKNGQIQIGKTPSVVSGDPSEIIKKGEALCKDEEAPLRLEDLDIDVEEHK